MTVMNANSYQGAHDVEMTSYRRRYNIKCLLGWYYSKCHLQGRMLPISACLQAVYQSLTVPGIVLSSTHANTAPKKLGFPNRISKTWSKSSFPENRSLLLLFISTIPAGTKH